MVKRKILFCLPANSYGGAEKSTLDLITDICDEFEIFLLLKCSGNPPFKHPLLSRLPHLCTENQEAMAQYIHQINPDIIQFYNSMAFPLAIELSGINSFVIQVLHANHLLEKDFSPIPNLFTNCFVGVSPSVFQFYPPRELEGIKTVVIEHGIDIDQKNIKQNYSPASKFVSHGRLDFESKHLDEMVKLFLDTNHQLHLYGDGPDKSQLEAMISGKSNVFLFSHTQSIPLYKYDAYCSWSKSEGFGMAILEALALGLPVIMRNCHGISESLKHNQHVLFFDSDEEFKSCVEQLQNPNIAKVLGSNALQLVKERYSRDEMVNKYRNLYHTSLD